MQAGRWVLGRWAKRAKAIQKGGRKDGREGGRLRRRPFYDGVGRLEDVSDTVRKDDGFDDEGEGDEVGRCPFCSVLHTVDVWCDAMKQR